MIHFRKVLALRGPNIWASFPVIEAWVELGEWDRPSTTFPGFPERLMASLPSMIEHRCGLGYRGGFFERVRTGTYLGHILEHVTLELQFLSGVDVAFGRARETSEPGVYRVVFKYRDEELARQCLEAGRELILAAIENRPFDLDSTVARLRDLAERNLMGPSTDAIVQAARARNIPFIRLDEYSLVQLGYGSRQRRIRAAETDATGAIAESIAQDKQLTRRMLQAAGVPTAIGHLVINPADAWETASEWIGVPVVVKPRDGNQGRGVATGLTTEQQVTAAFDAARREGSDVLVEKHAPGDDYRLLVVGGKVAAAARRKPAQVTGDGVRTVEQLVELENRDPRRAEHHANVLSKIRIDEVALQVLAEQGLTPGSVPEDGRTVLIRRNANLSTGGTAADVTDLLHPEVALRAVEAANAVGLDVAGVDVIAQDIAKPLEEQNGIVVEVNAAPGLRMHLSPSEGEPRAVGEAIVDTLFAPGTNGRIPIAAVTGTNGKTTVARFLAHILRGAGRRVGFTCTDGIYLGERRVYAGDSSGPASARMLLLNPNIDAAVLETARGGILRAGLAFNECHAAIVTNIGEGDHLGIGNVNTPEDLAKVKRTIVDVVGNDGFAVLNAADPLVAGMAPFCHGAVIFFARDPDEPVLAGHRERGRRAVFVRNGGIAFAEQGKERRVAALDEIPLTRAGRIPFEVENALAALAGAWAMGVPAELIRERARSFAADLHRVPIRFNVLQLEGATVIVDYGHNTHALKAIAAALDGFAAERRVALYSSSGDRRDRDIVAMGELLGNTFDRIILYEDTDRYGRPPGEILRLLREGVEKGTRVREVEEIEGGMTAFRSALDGVRPGDILVAQAHLANPAADYLRAYLRDRGVDLERGDPEPQFPGNPDSAGI